MSETNTDRLIGIAERVAAAFAQDDAPALPVYFVGSGDRLAVDIAELPSAVKAWAGAVGFKGDAQEFSLVPGADGAPSAALFGRGSSRSVDVVGALPRLKALSRVGRPVRLIAADLGAVEAAVMWALGAYRFDVFKKDDTPIAALETSAEAETRAQLIAESVYLARDLVNTPTNLLGPAALELAAKNVADAHGAKFRSLVGDALVEAEYPMIHAVGRSGSQPPRLIDFTWGDAAAPKLTIVGKGVCFDTGGLDLKPPAAMRNMKKDMGGSAAALALAKAVMAANLPVRLRVLIPAVENNVGPDAFRPGDVLRSRKGLTVEIGDTDAEGRLVLADALAEADSEQPDLLLDLATLTGAARVALGTEVAAFFTPDDALAASLADASDEARDPIWRLPLYQPYLKELSSRVADISNVATAGFGGAITAALFLQRFVSSARSWAHFDIFAWNLKARPGHFEGGEATAVRAIFEMLEQRFGRSG